MKTAILITGVVFVLMGCAEVSQQTDVPVMPTDYSTGSERVCARRCQDLYAQCSHACSEFPVSDIQAYDQRITCFNDCNQALKDCYSRCKKTL